jgi:ubiquinone/menaquinone biosynthesis C-methylase UbiE
MKEYILGANEKELARLRFQHGVWKEVTDSFLDKLGIQQGWKCLDAGAGPGFVTFDLRERVGEKGEVTAVEPTSYYCWYMKEEAEARHLSNIRVNEHSIEEAELQPGYFDLVFSRWVVAFVPDTEKFLRKLFESLKPGGIIAIQDYNYEGLSLFPRGGAFDMMPEIVKKYYRLGGGDPYVGALIPGIFRQNGIKLKEYYPVCLAGGPQSGVFQWAEKFFMGHTRLMAEKGLMSTEEADAALHDWKNHKENPDAIFFSPIVVNCAGVKTTD